MTKLLASHRPSWQVLNELAKTGLAYQYADAMPVLTDPDGANQNVLDALVVLQQFYKAKNENVMVTYGPMASGKSTALVKYYRWLKLRQIPVIIYKHELDAERMRGQSAVTVKIQAGLNGTDTQVEAALFHQLDEVIHRLKAKDLAEGVMILDEFMFAGEGAIPIEQRETMRRLIRACQKKPVKLVIGGLFSDYRGVIWPNMKRIIPLADRLIEFRGRCVEFGCMKPSVLTQRNVTISRADGEVITTRPSHRLEKVVRVGTVLQGVAMPDTYLPKCERHHEVLSPAKAKGLDQKFGVDMGDYKT